MFINGKKIFIHTFNFLNIGYFRGFYWVYKSLRPVDVGPGVTEVACEEVREAVG